VRPRLLVAVPLLAGLLLAVPVLAGIATRSADVPASGMRSPHVVVYSQTLGYRHASIDRAKDVLAELAEQHGFTMELTEDPAVLNPVTLARADAVIWLSNTAAADRASPFTDAQEALYERWMTCGGGHVGVHAAVDAYADDAFPAYAEANGAQFAGHPPGEPQVTILVADATSPMTEPWRGRASFGYREELYRLDRDPARVVHGFRLLLASAGGNGLPAGAPLSWSGSYRGHNRTFYTNLGHRSATWDDPAFRRHLVGGITWASRREADPSCLAR
jgi:type 1 glutamine amidotransferase